MVLSFIKHCEQCWVWNEHYSEKHVALKHVVLLFYSDLVLVELTISCICYGLGQVQNIKQLWTQTRQCAISLSKTRVHLLLRWTRSTSLIQFFFSNGVPLFKTFFLSTLSLSDNVAINHILSKTGFFWATCFHSIGLIQPLWRSWDLRWCIKSYRIRWCNAE